MRDLKNIVAAVDEYSNGSVYEISETFEAIIDEAFIVIDWREFDDAIVDLIAEKVQSTEQISVEPIGEALWVNFNGERYQLPLTMSGHDRYVTISSLAWLLRDKYDFWLLAIHLEDDTHQILITTKDESALLREEHKTGLEHKLVQLQIGFDYFNDVDIPYIEHENNATIVVPTDNNNAIKAEPVSPELPQKPWWKFW